MTDVMTKSQRSRCMSRIKRRDTKPEILLRSALWRRGLRYRVDVNLPGRPDIAFTRARIAVFVDGCFWHGCPVHGRIPTSNLEYWDPKLRRNIGRDKENNEKLEEMGWKVLRFWEHDVKGDLDRAVERVLNQLEKQYSL